MTAKALSVATVRRPRWPRLLRTWPLVVLLIFLGVFFLYPVLQLLWLSISARGELTTEHYAKLFSSPLYVHVIANTFRVALWATIFSVLAAYPLAYLLASLGPRSRQSLILWVLMPFWTSFLVRTFAWIVLLGRNGVVNDLLIGTGVTAAPLDLIYNFAAVMVGMCHALTPLAVLTMLSVMENIDPNLRKAAATLGARGAQGFWRIYFPLSLPGVAAAGLLVFVSAIGFFVTPALLGSPRETMIAQVMIFQVEELLNWGFAGAVGVLLLMVTLVIFYFYDRVVGISTLAGGADLGNQRTRSRRSSRRLSGAGRWITAVLGDVSSLVGAAVDRLVPLRSKRSQRPKRWILWVVGIGTLLFLAGPSFFLIPVSFTEGEFIEWPPRGFSLRWYEEYLSSPIWRAATLRSIGVGLATACLAMLIGVPAAFVLARRAIPGRPAILAFILTPLILPHIIVAVALFYLYARIGLVETSLGLVIAHTVFAVPFVVVTIIAVLRNYDERLDQAAATLGASPWTTARRVTLPVIRVGMFAAFVFAFVKSFDELTVAIFVSGGLATTLPRQMWSDAVLKVNPTLAAVSTVILLFVTVAIFTAEYLSRRGARR